MAINMTNIAGLLQDNFTTISVVFNGDAGSKAYMYKILKEWSVEVGDYAVVYARGELKIVEIVEVHESDQIDYEGNAYIQWAVAVFNIATQNELAEKDKAIQKAVRKKQAEQAKLDIREALKSELSDLQGILEDKK